jgi:uncharacterized peroxidase-related enzyme
MPYIALPPGQPGIRGPMVAFPEAAIALNQIAETLPVKDAGLARWERELIAAYVSFRNDCRFCYLSHKAFARELAEPDEQAAIDRFFVSDDDSEFRPVLKKLLSVAEAARKKEDTEAAIDAARQAGADDSVIHDTVLISAAFCMFNRYVDGLGTECPPENDPHFFAAARHVARHGYMDVSRFTKKVSA